MLSVKNSEEPSFSGENKVEGGHLVQGIIGNINIAACKHFVLSERMRFLVID